jgi:hypothetical protein
MEITVTVINPVDDSEVEVVLNLTTSLFYNTENKKMLSVSANGIVEV